MVAIIRQMEFLVTRGKDVDVLNEKKDLVELHTIRGRLLHYHSLIERIMKEYCNVPITRHVEQSEIERRFIRKLRQDGFNQEEIKKLKKALNRLRKKRNDWGHGFVFYKKRINEKTNNFIVNQGRIKKVCPPYFDKINSDLSFIFDWFRKNNLMEIEGYSINPI